MTPPVQAAGLPDVALDLLLFLERAEATVRDAAGAGGLHGDSSQSCSSPSSGKRSGQAVSSETLQAEEELWRAKLTAYEATLRDRLCLWENLGEASTECFRSRIEDLRPALERSLEARRGQLAPATGAAGGGVAPGFGATRSTAGITKTPSSIAAMKSRVEPSAAALKVWAAARAHALAPAKSEGLAPESADSLADPARSTVTVSPEVATSRQAASSALLAGGSSRKRRGEMSATARAGLESEMVDLAEGMKGAASSFLTTLKDDNRRLQDIATDQQESLDKVTAENEKTKQLMRSNSLSFVCTMIMVAVSAVIFFMMIPFIIFT
eukprot:TRINITY_DN57780_c0_g1_i1.p1 TRINITY_DN57780_c0_g1~~TRINITY_DN57780_c0_g1_i1.p1  ORF type:complete len:325 (-),score=89.30 TRINITY_DN57780_c0_g1_i1:122-1096(-)